MWDRAFSKFCSWLEENPGGMSLRRDSLGAILIEFAISVPILFTMIYYIHDLPRYKQLQERMSFAAHEIASILQNISRVNGRAITSQDIEYATRSANLTIFPGTTDYSSTNVWTGCPLGYITVTRVHYVEKTGGNEARVRWMNRTHPNYIDRYQVGGFTYNSYSSETKIESWSGTPESIYPDLKLAENEAKIIVEHKFETLEKDSKILGFYLLNPLRSHQLFDPLFNTIVIFSPVPGAFSATVPG